MIKTHTPKVRNISLIILIALLLIAPSSTFAAGYTVNVYGYTSAPYLRCKDGGIIVGGFNQTVTATKIDAHTCRATFTGVPAGYAEFYVNAQVADCYFCSWVWTTTQWQTGYITKDKQGFWYTMVR